MGELHLHKVKLQTRKEARLWYGKPSEEPFNPFKRSKYMQQITTHECLGAPNDTSIFPQGFKTGYELHDRETRDREDKDWQVSNLPMAAEEDVTKERQTTGFLSVTINLNDCITLDTARDASAESKARSFLSTFRMNGGQLKNEQSNSMTTNNEKTEKLFLKNPPYIEEDELEEPFFNSWRDVLMLCITWILILCPLFGIIISCLDVPLVIILVVNFLTKISFVSWLCCVTKGIPYLIGELIGETAMQLSYFALAILRGLRDTVLLPAKYTSAVGEIPLSLAEFMTWIQAPLARNQKPPAFRRCQSRSWTPRTVMFLFLATPVVALPTGASPEAWPGNGWSGWPFILIMLVLAIVAEFLGGFFGNRWKFYLFAELSSALVYVMGFDSHTATPLVLYTLLIFCAWFSLRFSYLEISRLHLELHQHPYGFCILTIAAIMDKSIILPLKPDLDFFSAYIPAIGLGIYLCGGIIDLLRSDIVQQIRRDLGMGG